MGSYSRKGSHRVTGTSAFFAEHGYLKVPSLVQWLAPLKCGLSCAHCLAVSEEAGFADMPLAKVHALIDEVAALGVDEFLVTGGEPLARPDLAEVIAYLGHTGVNWTLNTAALPDESLRQTIARHQPGFVAVSLDGPRQVHDAFRGKTGAYDEATEAIRFFKSLEGVRVCAGTTVTTRNYDHLDETFHLAVASGADQWGIHLLVPEGRAAGRPNLFLSKSQLKRLIKFVARKRRYFRVEMADEIGYLGSLEPLVRDRPLTCGAGRAQCVVLPDGEVVPCTTLDRSASAGNIHERSLMNIWTQGFADLRTWQPTGKCGHCDYAVACKGGCWLQRKAGQQCFKEVWHVPGALKTAASIAICLGSLAASSAPNSAQATVSPTADTTSTAPARHIRPRDDVQIAQNQRLDEAILEFYIELAADMETDSYGRYSDPVDASDPGGQFFLDFKAGTLPVYTTACCTRVLEALQTRQPSLSLIALLWRVVNGPLLETPGPTSETGTVTWGYRADPIDNDGTVRAYSAAERQTIRNTLTALQEKADAWRLEIFTGNLDPYLSDGRTTIPPYSCRTKSGRCSGDDEMHALLIDLNEERWGKGENPDSYEATEAFFLEHRLADQMDLVYTFYRAGNLTHYTHGQENLVESHVNGVATGAHTIGIFDVISAPEQVSLSFVLEGTLQAEPYRSREERALLNDSPQSDTDLSATITVTLQPGGEYTYVELLQEIYQRQRDTLLPMAYDWLPHEQNVVWDESARTVVAVQQNGALLWPAFREIMESEGILRMGTPRAWTELELSEEDLKHARLKEIDFWMF